MVSLASLWLPILLSAVVVWLASAIVWMVLPHHKTDFRRLPDEEGARDALRPQDPAPGQYAIPHCASPAAMKEPEMQRKFEEGPVAFVTVVPRGMPAMGKAMALTLVFYLVVAVAAGYVASRTLAAGAEYLAVFRVVGTVAWIAHGAAVVPDAIWFGRPWSTAFKHIADGLLYGLLTAGVFAWLWP